MIRCVDGISASLDSHAGSHAGAQVNLITTCMESFACLLAVGVSYNNICSIDSDSGAFRRLLSERRKDAWAALVTCNRFS